MNHRIVKDRQEADELSLHKKSKIITQTFDECIREYVVYLRSPGRIFFLNILVGLARGFGVILGMTVVVAFFLFIINLLGGVPVIGDIFQWVGGQISQGVPGSLGDDVYKTQRINDSQ